MTEDFFGLGDTGSLFDTPEPFAAFDPLGGSFDPLGGTSSLGANPFFSASEAFGPETMVVDTSLPPDQRIPMTIAEAQARTGVPIADILRDIQIGAGPAMDPNTRLGAYDPASGRGSGTGFLDWLSQNQGLAAALGLGGLPALIGLAGVGQQLVGGGGNTSTTTVRPNVAPPSGTEEAARNAALTGVQQAQQFAFGGPQGTANLLGARVPAEEASFDRAIQELVGASGTHQALQTALSPALYGSLPALLGQQALTLGQLPGQANAYLTNPAISQAQQTQALGMSQGRLPALDPAIQQRIGQVFDVRRQNLLRDILDAGRQRGFAGGLETLREPPGNLAGPFLADLGGQQAMAELQYASQLPLLGAQLENQRVQTGQAGLQGLINASSAYTTPTSVLGGLGMNLMNINQNLARALGDIGQAGVANRTDFLRAISAPLSVANQTASTLSQERLLGAPRTQLTQQAPSLLSAFAPTAQLLAGTGGLLSGLGDAGLFK